MRSFVDAADKKSNRDQTTHLAANSALPTTHAGTIPNGADYVMIGAPLVMAEGVGQGGATVLQQGSDVLTGDPVITQQLGVPFCTANLTTPSQLQNAANLVTGTPADWGPSFTALTGFPVPVSVAAQTTAMSAREFLDSVRAVTGIQGQLQGITQQGGYYQTSPGDGSHTTLAATVPASSAPAQSPAAPQGTGQGATATGTNVKPLASTPVQPQGMGLLGPTDCKFCQELRHHWVAIALAIGGLLALGVGGL